MKDLHVKTLGIRGGNYQYKAKVGLVVVTLPEDRSHISVDNLQGFGDTYKQREDPEILIQAEGMLLFKGSAKELIRLLGPESPDVIEDVFKNLFTDKYHKDFISEVLAGCQREKTIVQYVKKYAPKYYIENTGEVAAFSLAMDLGFYGSNRKSGL